MRYSVSLLEEGSGFVMNDIKAGEDLKTKKLVYINRIGRWKYANRDSLEAMQVMGITLQAMKKGLKGPVLVGWGIVGNPDWSFTLGATLYVSSIPGEIIEESISGYANQIGYAYDHKTICFNVINILNKAFIFSNPPEGGKKITNIWWDPDTKEIVTDHE